jgi:hypothetical protein
MSRTKWHRIEGHVELSDKGVHEHPSLKCAVDKESQKGSEQEVKYITGSIKG